MYYLRLLQTFFTGVYDGASMGLVLHNPHLGSAYDHGANVGEWMWDLVHNKPIGRWPWKQRRYVP